MTTIERTAYPHLNKSRWRKSDLQRYIPSHEDLEYMSSLNIRSDLMRLNFILQLKTYQQLNYFPKVGSIPKPIVKQVRQALDSPHRLKSEYTHTATLYRHRNLIRKYLGVNQDNEERDLSIMQTAEKISKIMNDPADIINAVLETIAQQKYELPAFTSLDRTVLRIRKSVNDDIFKLIKKRLSKDEKLDTLHDILKKKEGDHKTPYHYIKRLPKKPTVTHFKKLVDHHNWLMSFGDFKTYLSGVSGIKVAQFSEEARSLNAGSVKQMHHSDKKFSLIACLLAQSQRRAKDALGLTFCRCIHGSDKSAIRSYESEDKNKEQSAESLAEFLLDMTTEYEKNKYDEKKTTERIKNDYKKYGGTSKVIQDCEKILMKEDHKHLPLIWQHYHSKRAGIFSFLKSINLDSIKEEAPLLKAIKVVQSIRETNKKQEWFTPANSLDLSFVPKDWLKLIVKDKKTINARHFEVCVMSQLREKLRASDIYIKGADSYGDYRQELLPWNACKKLLKEFCELVSIPSTAKKMCSTLKKQLKDKSLAVDQAYPALKELNINEKGIPFLKKSGSKRNPRATALRDTIKSRMPERNLLDVMCLVQHCTGWAHSFSPASGSDAKLSDPIGANIVTAFGYGSGMGPAETARHVRSSFSERTIASINKTHVNIKKLNAALVKIINYYKGFPLVKSWGDGSSVAVDGTLRNIYEQNLLAESHYRYKAKGAIAYHHISDTYIALFSSLIPCGVWEAIAIIEGLLQNKSEIKPRKVHGDTQAQSTPVFGLSYLFGIDLMPRIRRWKDLTFYKADDMMELKNIGNLFKGKIDWDLIEKYWEDMMQVVLSIQHGKVSSDLILSKLNSRNKSSKLYRAFRELGNVIRTLFLLGFISDPDLRETITAETNKVESYNNLSDWVRFASEIIVASNDTVEMEKAIKYNTLLSNMVILQNVIDISRIIVSVT